MNESAISPPASPLAGGLNCSVNLGFVEIEFNPDLGPSRGIGAKADDEGRTRQGSPELESQSKRPPADGLCFRWPPSSASNLYLKVGTSCSVGGTSCNHKLQLTWESQTLFIHGGGGVSTSRRCRTVAPAQACSVV